MGGRSRPRAATAAASRRSESLLLPPCSPRTPFDNLPATIDQAGRLGQMLVKRHGVAASYIYQPNPQSSKSITLTSSLMRLADWPGAGRSEPGQNGPGRCHSCQRSRINSTVRPNRSSLAALIPSPSRQSAPSRSLPQGCLKVPGESFKTVRPLPFSAVRMHLRGDRPQVPEALAQIHTDLGLRGRFPIQKEPRFAGLRSTGGAPAESILR